MALIAARHVSLYLSNRAGVSHWPKALSTCGPPGSNLNSSSHKHIISGKC